MTTSSHEIRLLVSTPVYIEGIEVYSLIVYEITFPLVQLNSVETLPFTSCGTYKNYESHKIPRGHRSECQWTTNWKSIFQRMHKKVRTHRIYGWHWLVRKLLYTTSIEHFGRVEPSIVLGLCYTNIGEMRAYDLYLCILLEDDHRSWLKVRPWSVANIYDWLTHPVECYFEMAPGELYGKQIRASERRNESWFVCLLITQFSHLRVTWFSHDYHMRSLGASIQKQARRSIESGCRVFRIIVWSQSYSIQDQAVVDGEDYFCFSCCLESSLRSGYYDRCFDILSFQIIV